MIHNLHVRKNTINRYLKVFKKYISWKKNRTEK